MSRSRRTSKESTTQSTRPEKTKALWRHDVRITSGVALMEDLEKLEFWRKGTYALAFGVDCPLPLKKSLIGAYAAYMARVKSIDYFMKQYGSDIYPYEHHLDQDLESIPLAVNEVVTEVNRIAGLVPALYPDSPGVGFFAASHSLYRLKASFEAASLLIKCGFLYEAIAVVRLILEQCAWCVQAIDCTEEDQLLALNPTFIQPLKSLIASAGSLYGQLSDMSHMNPTTHSLYLGEAGGKVVVSYRHHAETSLGAHFLIQALDVYGIVTEHVLGRLVHSPVYWTNIGSKRELASQRPPHVIVSKFGKQLAALIERVFADKEEQKQRSRSK